MATATSPSCGSSPSTRARKASQTHQPAMGPPYRPRAAKSGSTCASRHCSPRCGGVQIRPEPHQLCAASGTLIGGAADAASVLAGYRGAAPWDNQAGRFEEVLPGAVVAQLVAARRRNGLTCCDVQLIA
jgi:hypothetical protein